MPLLIHEAGAGNYVPLGSQFMMTMISLLDALSLGMHNAVMCAEDVPFYDRSTIDYDGLAASYMGAFQLDALEAICSVWPAGPVDDDIKQPLATALAGAAAVRRRRPDYATALRRPRGGRSHERHCT